MNTSGVSLCHYRYSALDLLTRIEPAGQQPLQRFYCREHLATELQGVTSQSVLQQGNQLLALQSRDSRGINSQLLTTDQQRSVLQVTDPNGSVHQVYSPYGHRRVESGPGSLLGFNGEAVDPLTRHYLLGNGHRLFNPVLMRFNRPDELSPFGRGGLNPYAYCLGDPVNYSDPTGRFADIGRLLTSLFSLGNARIVLAPAIPYKLAKEALQWGAVGQLPLKHTAGAAGSTIAGVTTVLAAITGVGSAVAAINKDTEAAAVLGFMGLGLGAITLSGRVVSGWSARSKKTIPSLSSFVNAHKKPEVKRQSFVDVSQLSPEHSAIQSHPASAPIPTAGPSGVGGFQLTEYSARTADFLYSRPNVQHEISRNSKTIRRSI